MIRQALFVLSSIVGAGVIGCGSDLPKTIKVTGKVTFDRQPPPGPGTVYFLPMEPAEGFPVRPATADFDRSGSFQTTTFNPGDGLMPGKYFMHVECWQTPPNMEGKPVKSFVPRKYQSAETSGFRLDLTPDMQSQQLLLDLVTK
jgi:hypothetical protein